MKNLELCPANSEHAEIFLAWRQEASTRKFNPLKNLNLEELKDLLTKCKHDLSHLEENQQYRWFVKIDGAFVGQVGLNSFNQMMGTAEIGYTIAAKYQGRGFATAAVRVLLDRVFNQTPTRRVFALVHQQNLASCRVLDKLGFTREGLLREHYIVNDQPANEIVYGLLRSEWISNTEAN